MDKEIQNFKIKNKELFWDIPKEKLHELSDQATLERILSFGTWDNVSQLVKILGETESKTLFEKLISKKRPNLDKKAINLFSNYFEINAH